MEFDLSLIEIAGEDDYLLQQIPNDDVSTLKTNQRSNYSDYFSCSPLQLPRSKPTEGKIVNGDLEKTSSSCTDSINIENSNSSKAEAPKLSVERQQMKRKKKGGGYNLRKSLAWDRAFFTEEGILNSAELSMINGDCSKSGGDMLSVIEEEGPNCSNDSSDLQARQENLFKELPSISSNKERSTAGGLLPKLDSSPVVSSVRRKVLSAHDVNRSGSKRSGCPRAVASSSLKKPANSNTTKAATKYPQVSKLPVLKPDPSAVSRIPKSAIPGGSGSKRNQMAQPAINIQKSTVLKASSNNSKNVLNNTKPVPAGKSLTTKTSLGQARRNVASSVKRLSTNLKLSPKVTSNPSLPSAGYASKADDGSRNPPLPSARYASKADDGSRKFAIPLPQNACYTGVSMQHVQPQIAKSSGLRMPSPSLGFFGQPKAPSLHNPLNTNSQRCNLPKSTIPNLGNLGAQNPIHALRPPLVPQKIPKVVNGGATAVNIKVSCSNSGSSVPSIVNPALLEHIEVVPQGTDMPKVEKKVQHDHNSYEAIKNQNMLHRVVDMDQQLVELAEPCISETTSQMEGIELQRNDKNCEVGLSNENQMLQASNEDLFNKSQGPEELQSFNCGKVVDICSKVQDLSAAEIENSNASSHLQFKEKEEDDNRVVDEVSTKSHADDAGGQSLDGNITVASSNSNLRTLMVNQHKLVIADVNEKYKHLESLSTSVAGEQGSTDDGSKLDDCLASANNFYLEESTDKNVPHCVESAEPDEIGTSKSESKHLGAPCLIPLAMLDHGSNLDKLECHNLDDTTAGSKEVVDNYNLGSQFLHDIEHHDQPIYMELENMDEDQLTGAEMPKDVEVNCQKSGHSDVGELENPFSTSEDLKNKEVNLLVENSCPNSNLQPEGEFCPFHDDNSKEHIDIFRGVMNVDKHHEEQGKVIVSCFSEIDRIAYGEKQSMEVHLLAEDSQSLEASQKLNSGNGADVNSNGLESPNGLSMCKHMEEASKKNDDFIGEALLQACNGSSLVDSCSSDKSPSGVNSQYLVVVDKKNKQYGKCELQKSRNGIEQVYTDNVPGIYLNATLVANKSTEEFKYENVSESAFEQCDGRGNDSAQVVSVVQDGCLDVNKEAEYLEMEITVTDSIAIEPSVETMQCFAQPQHSHENELSGQATSLEFDLSSKVNNNEISRDPLTFNSTSFSSLDEESGSSVIGDETSSSERILSNNDISVLRDKSLPNEAENILSHNSHTLSSELQPELGNTIHADDINAGTKRKSGNNKKQDTLLIKPPSNAVPFSDEWLAAFEAAGEEILTMKSGAVQHSPPDKSQPEPGPWSPVKRKNTQVIGPFDCTKYSNITNIPPPPSPH